ncbi:unnamed protein product [Aphanomyces euteiches]|uniref:GST N-terminal domain-containing protein n=1 Tax=Aphanomyces euteiches TaxID=100861 RepID=A0A6G0WDQ8_9STRA|nr:hypothetical protein Ae201684_016089 [Aphanomyces euteiches]KAH9078629.1 hypothetical protein Ae201684P_019708 [Aphanomyces euteiches]KAH9134518.1 hypothetical protein AeRB84_019715 [Aphanomyces euteiches]
MALPSIKLTYFDFEVLAEPTRLAFTLGEIPFQDERIDGGAWAALKPSMPYQTLPILTVDGQVLGQSKAIARYAAKLAGLYPLDNHVDACLVDEVGDFFQDILHAIIPTLFETDAAKKEIMETQLLDETLPAMFAMLEARVASMPSNDPWYLSKMTVADLYIYTIVTVFKVSQFQEVKIPTDICSKYSRVMEIYDAVANHPKVAAWNLAHKKSI